LRNYKISCVFTALILVALLFGSFPVKHAFADTETRYIISYEHDDEADEWRQTTTGLIGSPVKVEGHGFVNEQRLLLYLSSDTAVNGDEIDREVTNYKMLGRTYTDDTVFRMNFIVPDELDDGETNGMVEYGNYHIYATLLDSKIIAVSYSITLLRNRIEANSAEGKIGDWVKLHGEGFDPNQQISIYFSSDEAFAGDYIGNGVTAYEATGQVNTDAYGNFAQYPFAISGELTHGGNIKAIYTGKCYIYATYYFGEGLIEAVTNFTVLPSLALYPEEGMSGTMVEITGEGLSGNQPITARYDGDKVDITAGDTKTDITGHFTSTIIIPTSTCGEHVVTFEDELGNRRNAIFLVKPQVNAEPASGATGTSVTVNGEGFSALGNITVTYGDSGRILSTGTSESDGLYNGTVIIPESPAGENTITVTDGTGNKAEAIFNMEPGITITPVPASSGDSVEISGTGFVKADIITVTFDDSEVATIPESMQTDLYGSFKGSFTVPVVSTASDGSVHIIGASDSITNTAEASLNLSIASPGAAIAAISLSPPNSITSPGYVGMELTVQGAAFIANSPVTITYGGEETLPIATAATDEGGAFSTAFIIPQGNSGSYDVNATDGTNSATATFILESKSPPVPDFLSIDTTLNGQTITHLDWKDATDPSGVTYHLQAGADLEFTQILLEKTGLTDSAYTMTKADRLKSGGKSYSYFWRVKAVDGASNESEWSFPETIQTEIKYKPIDTIDIEKYLWIIMGVLVLVIIGTLVSKRFTSH